MLTALFGRVETWHSSRFLRPWLGPLPMTRGLILAALVLAVVAIVANVKVRYDQGQIWKANPEVNEIAGAMSFSTADAPYFRGMRQLPRTVLRQMNIFAKEPIPMPRSRISNVQIMPPQLSGPCCQR